MNPLSLRCAALALVTLAMLVLLIPVYIMVTDINDAARTTVYLCLICYHVAVAFFLCQSALAGGTYVRKAAGVVQKKRSNRLSRWRYQALYRHGVETAGSLQWI
jgi:hypothetical protein